MKLTLSTPAAILAGAVLIALAIYLKPAPQTQALYGDGYIYVIDLQSKNIANIIPGKTVKPQGLSSPSSNASAP